MNMDFLKSVINAQRYKRKQSVTSDEFIEAMEADFDRPLDANSTFFFRHHPVTINLLHRVLTGQANSKGTEADPLIVTALMLDMTEYLTEITEGELEKINGSDSIAARFGATLEAFSKTYPDAGNIINQGINAYFQVCDKSSPKSVSS